MDKTLNNETAIPRGLSVEAVLYSNFDCFSPFFHILNSSWKFSRTWMQYQLHQLCYKRASLNESGCSPTPLGSFKGDRIRGFVSAERGIVLWVLPKVFGEGRRKEIVGRVGPLLVSPQSSIMLVENTFAQ